MRMNPTEHSEQALEVFLGEGRADVELLCQPRGPVGDCRKSSDDDELNLRLDQSMDQLDLAHELALLPA